MNPADVLIPLFQTDSPLLIRPFVSGLTRSEFHAVMTGGFASISGTILGAYISFGVRRQMHGRKVNRWGYHNKVYKYEYWENTKIPKIKVCGLMSSTISVVQLEQLVQLTQIKIN